MYQYLEQVSDVYLCFIVNRYDPAIVKQTAADKKIYVIDNGLLNAISFKFSSDYGKLMENMIFLELCRQNGQVFYYKGKRECDFIQVIKDKVVSCCQACYSLDDPATRQRELEGLTEACSAFNLQGGRIITWNEQETLDFSGIKIEVITLKDFLLEKAA